MTELVHAMGMGWDARVRVHAWLYSLTLHMILAGLVFLVGSRITMVPPEEPFRWNVAMVEPIQPQESPAIEEPIPSVQQPTKPQPQPPKPVVQQVSEAVPVEQRVETYTPPVMQRAETRPVEQVVDQKVQETDAPQPVEPVTETRPSAVEVPMPIEAEPAHTAATVYTTAQSVESQPIESTPSTTSVQSPGEVVDRVEPSYQPTATVTQSVQTAAVTTVPEAVSQPIPQVSDAPIQREERQVVASLPKAVPSHRADYGWVRDAIWRRIVEMKHYPSQARLNHWEGKVVLRAVIRSDGHLGDLIVKETSGHRILDDAALEVVRRICPIRLRYDLGRPEIVVMIPIDYRLD